MVKPNNIPVVDLSSLNGSDNQRLELAQELKDVCHNVGFFIARNHGIPSRKVDQVFDCCHQFFRLPVDQKRLIDKRNSPYFRGWESEGSEYTNNRPDIREQIDLWTEHPPVTVGSQPDCLKLLGPNQWLPETILPGFKAVVSDYIDEMKVLGDKLMGVLAISLGLPVEHFDEMFGKTRMSLAKLIHYPETPSGEFGVNAHHDTGFLTILNPGEVPGLEIQLVDGSWMPVPIVKDGFVINLGEMLQAVTGNYYIATPHRVVASAKRLSIGYFHGPALETSIERLPLSHEYADAVAVSPRHRNAGFMAPIMETQSGVGDMKGTLRASTFGEQLWNYFCRSYPDNVQRFYPDFQAPGVSKK